MKILKVTHTEFKIRHQIRHIYLKSTHPKVHIPIWVQESWGSKPLWMDLPYGLKIEPKLEDWFLILGGVFSWMGINEIQQESDALQLHFVT